MNIQSTHLHGVLMIEPRVFQDSRGYFYEGYSPQLLERIGLTTPFVQENVSGSERRVLRGLHYQLNPYAQGKLVRVTSGEVFDVVVDLRRGSPTFGKWLGTTLSSGNRLRMWIPNGFAHGFCVLSPFAEFVYSVTQPYSPSHERTILWNDPVLGIAWPGSDEGFLLSEKDRAGVRFSDAEINFDY